MHKFSARFVEAIQITWDQIGDDILNTNIEEDIEHREVVAACLDADRLLTFAGSLGPDAQAEFQARMKEVGYQAALKEAEESLPFPLV